MKITKKIKITEEKEVVIDNICNMCGYSLNRGPYDDIYGVLDISYVGGYDSGPLIKDEDRYLFSLCENCLAQIISQFKIPARVENDLYKFAITNGKQVEIKIQETLEEIYKAKDVEALAQYLTDPNETIRSYASIRYQQLK